jgi:hypothetical protein
VIPPPPSQHSAPSSQATRNGVRGQFFLSHNLLHLLLLHTSHLGISNRIVPRENNEQQASSTYSAIRSVFLDSRALALLCLLQAHMGLGFLFRGRRHLCTRVESAFRKKLLRANVNDDNKRLKSSCSSLSLSRHTYRELEGDQPHQDSSFEGPHGVCNLSLQHFLPSCTFSSDSSSLELQNSSFPVWIQ